MTGFRNLAAGALIGLALSIGAAQGAGAFECPKPPQQTAPLVQKELTRTSSSLLGKSQIVERITSASQNLYADYPHADQMVIKLTQMFIFCSFIKDSKLPAEEKAAWYLNYERSLNNTPGRSPPLKPARTKPSETARQPSDPPWAVYHMSQKQAEAAVTPEEAKAKAWCVPSFPDSFLVQLAERDRFLYLGAAQAALARTGRIRIRGYSFEIGMSAAYGLGLSMRKARAVADMLAAMGVPADAIEVDGMGATGAVEPIGSRYCGVVIS